MFYWNALLPVPCTAASALAEVGVPVVAALERVQLVILWLLRHPLQIFPVAETPERAAKIVLRDPIRMRPFPGLQWRRLVQSGEPGIYAKIRATAAATALRTT